MDLFKEHILFSDISASESIMKKKTQQDFQELLKTEHCEILSVQIPETLSESLRKVLRGSRVSTRTSRRDSVERSSLFSFMMGAEETPDSVS